MRSDQIQPGYSIAMAHLIRRSLRGGQLPGGVYEANRSVIEAVSSVGSPPAAASRRASDKAVATIVKPHAHQTRRDFSRTANSVWSFATTISEVLIVPGGLLSCSQSS